MTTIKKNDMGLDMHQYKQKKIESTMVEPAYERQTGSYEQEEMEYNETT